jgi:flagellin-like hook-associated protein FlgL
MEYYLQSVAAQAIGYTCIGNDMTITASDLTIESLNNQNDKLTVLGNSNNVIAQNGTKNIHFVGDNNTYNGSDDVNVISIEGSGNNIITKSSSDYITVISGSDNMISTDDGGDIVNISSANNTIDSGDGNDIVTLIGANNILNSGDGDDIVYLDGTNDIGFDINTGSGNDTIEINSSNSAEINMGSGDDIIIAKSNNNSNIVSGNDNDKILDYGANNAFVNTSGDDIYYSYNAIDSKLTNVNSYRLQGDNGSFIITDSGNEAEIVAQDGSYKLKTTNSDTRVEYTQTNSGLILSVDNAEIKTSEDVYSNLTVNGSGNSVELSNSMEAICTINGNSNTILAGTGNYDVTITGEANEVTMSEGVAFVEVQGGSVDNIINGNDAKVSILNMGANTFINNCDNIVKATSDIKLQVGINGDPSSTIKVSTGLTLGRLSFNVSNSEYAGISMEKADSLIAEITEKVTEIGAQYSRLGSALEANEIEQLNLTSSKSTLQDADVAELTSEYVKSLIIQQSSSILSVTVGNLHSDNVLRLLKAL